jgi:glycine dehydrogenase
VLWCSFAPRHNSGTPGEVEEMVKLTNFPSLDALIDATVPKAIRRKDGMDLGEYTQGYTETQFLEKFKCA